MSEVTSEYVENMEKEYVENVEQERHEVLYAVKELVRLGQLETKHHEKYKRTINEKFDAKLGIVKEPTAN